MDGGEETVPTGRAVDIELTSQEVITVDLDNLDPDPKDILDLLNEGHPKVWVWTKLAAEYWRRGYLDAAEQIARSAATTQDGDGNTGSLPPIFALLANIQVAHARTKPKIKMAGATMDIIDGQKTKDDFYGEAAQMLNKSQSAAAAAAASGTEESLLSSSLALLTRGIQQLATRSMDDAMRTFEAVLKDKPTNLVALLGQARIQYARRNYAMALHTFQQVLRYNPRCKPDPRIGIGLCYWAVGNKNKAKAAWERSLEVNPTEWATRLLLGLERINSSKNEEVVEQERVGLYQSGVKFVEQAFKASGQSSAAAANALCELFLQKGQNQRAMKLAERTIQFADTLTVLTEGYVRAGRISHIQGDTNLATKHFTSAHEGQKKNVLANLGLAQMQILSKSNAGAIHTLDNLIQAIKPQESFEAAAILASLRTLNRAEVAAKDVAEERGKAKELFDRIARRLEADNNQLNGPSSRGRISRVISEDMDMYVEIASLWQNENLERTITAVTEALRICQSAGTSSIVEVQLLNNLGVLKHLMEKLPDARLAYEASLMKAAALGADGEGFSTTILYNLARVYEDQGEDNLAKDAYEKLLSRHPEYVDAKVRQANMLANLHRNNEAHDLLKQALASCGSDLNVRAFYTYFLIRSGSPKLAKDFVFGTLKDHDKHDVYSLCAAGLIMYGQARESRDTSSKGAEERRRGFQRSAEFYEKALQLDANCAYAAQGLAIVTAEDAMGALSSGQQEDPAKRMRNAREALDVFGKVRESLNDGSVYFNMGHCYYSRDEYDRAIENYETSMRFSGQQNTSALLCLCRSWYAKATKDQSYKAMQTALKFAQRALHLCPSDKAILYNIAMIQQKSAEMMFSIDPSRRHLEDLEHVIDQAAHAQKLFASLASDKAAMVPYSRDIADQRRKYGDIMLRKGDEHLAKQKAHEEQVATRLRKARDQRRVEREEIERIEAEKRHIEEAAAKVLAEERRKARETAKAWAESKTFESDEEDTKKKKRTRKTKEEKEKEKMASGDEGAPKKKRRGKLKKKEIEEGEEQSAQPSEEDAADAEKPSRKRKKRVVRDEDEEEAEALNPKKKQFKSKEILSDTEDEDEKPVPMDVS